MASRQDTVTLLLQWKLHLCSKWNNNGINMNQNVLDMTTSVSTWVVKSTQTVYFILAQMNTLNGIGLHKVSINMNIIYENLCK